MKCPNCGNSTLFKVAVCVKCGWVDQAAPEHIKKEWGSEDDGEATRSVAKSFRVQPSSEHTFIVAMYAIFGYIVLFGSLFLLLGLGALMVASVLFSGVLFFFLIKSKLIFVVLVAMWGLLKALWVKIEPPQGYVLSREKHPALFEEIDSLRHALATPIIHRVILVTDLNAAVHQTPRLGILGYPVNTLMLGLEILFTLSPEQARAVLAHELGHLSGNHAAFGNWIYRAQVTWERILNGLLNRPGGGGKPILTFAKWYVPRLAKRTTALMRANEFQADAISAELTSPEAAASALLSIHVIGPYAEESYWKGYVAEAKTHPQPPYAAWTGLRRDWPSLGSPTEGLEAAVTNALAVKTHSQDTHPALAERLAALNWSESVPPPAAETAAEAWLGDALDEIIEAFDEKWWALNEAAWTETFKRATTGRARLHELKAKPLEELDDQTLFELSQLTDEFESPEKALELLRLHQKRRPDDCNTALLLAQILFDRGEEETLDQLKTAAKNPVTARAACQIAEVYLRRRGRLEELKFWEGRWEEMNEYDRLADQERVSLEPNSTMVPVTVPQEAIARIAKALRKQGFRGDAWLAQKHVEYYPEHPAVGIALVHPRFSLSSKIDAQRFVEETELNWTFWVVHKSGETKKLAKHILRHGVQILGEDREDD